MYHRRRRSFVPFIIGSCVLSILCGASIAPAANESRWVGSWYSPPQEAAPSFADATVRTVVHLTTGGERLRLRFSNLYGHTALKIGAGRVSTEAGGGDVTFEGRRGTTVPAGASAVSDPVSLETLAGKELVVSVFYPEPIPREITQQWNTAESNALTPGNTAREVGVAPAAKMLEATYFLTGVEVESQANRGTIVVLADSMTGGGSKKWPAFLAQRLAAGGKHYGVLNAAIGGNRILRDSQIAYGGPGALKRFERDVLEQPGTKYIIVYEGLNDIGVADLDGFQPPHPASAAEVIGGLRQLVERAHAHGIKIYVATQAPFGDRPPNYVSPDKEQARRAVNEWVRRSQEIDGYFDFERVLADPARPDHLKPAYDWQSHPNETGQRALSEAIDLSRFE